ncbi:MAG: DUF721 domain-containing protein [Puniceicoccales bacterium]|jgi:hypothetical protein|nr:DUF721 domain-containing protein [Puniceicoccales bacterium]
MAKGRFGRRIRNLIAAFRGLPPEESRSFPKKAKPIGESIAILLKKIRPRIASPEREIQSNWEAIVGKDMAGRCHPLRILGSDVLLIHSGSAVIRSELQMQKAKILENLHRLGHCAKISDIRFIANG